MRKKHPPLSSTLYPLPTTYQTNVYVWLKILELKKKITLKQNIELTDTAICIFLKESNINMAINSAHGREKESL